jgi:WD40 repeat protein
MQGLELAKTLLCRENLKRDYTQHTLQVGTSALSLPSSSLAHTDNFVSLVIAPNGTKFVTTSHDKTMRFFDLTTFEQIGEPLEHPDSVLGLAFSDSEDSQSIATGCQDKLVRTWTVPLSETELQQVSKSSRCVILHADLPYSPLRKFSRYAFTPVVLHSS